MAEKVVIDIELKGFSNAKKGLEDLTKSQIMQQDAIKATKQQIKEYEKELALFAKARELGANLTDEQVQKENELNASIQNSKIQLAGQNDELSKVNTARRVAVKEVETYNAVLDAEIGSNEQLKAQLKLLTTQYNGLSKEQRENSAEGQQMTTDIEALTEKLKSNEKAVGDNRRNVGNYSGAITEAFGNTQVFGVSLNGLKDSFQATKDTTTGLIKNLVITDSVIKSQTASTTGMTLAQKGLNAATIAGKVAMNIFKLALIATGVGAFVVVIGSLAAYFLSTQKGAEVLRTVMAGLGATINVLKDRITSFGGGLSKIFSGDFSGGFKDMQNSFKGIGDEIQREVELVTELQNKLISLEKREIAASVARSEINKQIKEQNRLAEDTTLGINERIKAAEKVIELEKNQIKIENDLSNKRLQNALQLEGTQKQQQVQLKLITTAFKQGQEDVDVFNEKLLSIGVSKATVDDVKEIAEAIISNNNAIAASEEVLTTAGNKLNTLNQQRANEQKKAVTDSQAASVKQKSKDNERLASLDELLRSEKEELEFKKDKLLQELELSDESKTLTATEASAKKVIIEKYNQDVRDLEQKAIDDRKKKIKEDEAIVKEAAAKALKDKITELEYLKFIKLEDEKLTNKERQEIELQFQEDKANIILDELKSQAAMIKAELEQLSADTGISLIKPLTPEEETELKDQLNLINEEIGKVNEEINGVDSEQEGLNLLNGLGLDEEGMAKLEFSFQTITASISAIGNLMGAVTQRNKKLIQEQVDEGVISQDQADKKIAKIELRAFKRQKALQISMAAINTAQAILMALAQTTDFTPVQALRIANAATIGVLGGVQIATIAAQKFEEGGLIKGASHSKGGVPFSVAGRGGFEAEGGEFIHKTKAVEHYGLPFMNALNNMQLPKVFAEGGYVAPMTSSSISQQVSAGVSELVSESQNRSIQVLNVESDFSNLQNKVNNVESARTY
jgi:hypothetical protein